MVSVFGSPISFTQNWALLSRMLVSKSPKMLLRGVESKNGYHSYTLSSNNGGLHKLQSWWWQYSAMVPPRHPCSAFARPPFSTMITLNEAETLLTMTFQFALMCFGLISYLDLQKKMSLAMVSFWLTPLPLSAIVSICQTPSPPPMADMICGQPPRTNKVSLFSLCHVQHSLCVFEDTLASSPLH